MKPSVLAAYSVFAAWGAVIIYGIAIYLIPATIPPIFNWIISPSDSRTLTIICITAIGVIVVTILSFDVVQQHQRHKKMLAGD